jgi:hypothetical protein
MMTLKLNCFITDLLHWRKILLERMKPLNDLKPPPGVAFRAVTQGNELCFGVRMPIGNIRSGAESCSGNIPVSQFVLEVTFSNASRVVSCPNALCLFPVPSEDARLKLWNRLSPALCKPPSSQYILNLPTSFVAMTVKVKKIKFSLCHEDLWGDRSNVLSFLTSAPEGSEWSALRPGRFIPWERALATNWIGRWVSPSRAGHYEERKNLTLPGIEPGP